MLVTFLNAGGNRRRRPHKVGDSDLTLSLFRSSLFRHFTLIFLAGTFWYKRLLLCIKTRGSNKCSDLMA